MKTVAVLVFVGLFTALVTPASAEVVLVEEIGVSVLVPDGWESQREDGSLSAMSDDGEIWMSVWAERADNVQSSLEAVYDSLAGILKGFEIFTRGEVLRDGYSEEPTEADVYYIGGMGRAGEQVMTYSLALMDAGEEVAVVLVFFDGYDDKVNEHDEITEPILTSLKVLK